MGSGLSSCGVGVCEVCRFVPVATPGACRTHGQAAPEMSLLAAPATYHPPVRIERGMGFLPDGVRPATRADQHDRVQVMGIGAMHLALRRSEMDLGHAGIIGRSNTTRRPVGTRCLPDGKDGLRP